MSKSQRTKGAAGEREVCSLLRDSLGIEVNRNLSQTRDGGCDIAFNGFHVEVKRRKKLSVYDFMKQAEASCTNHEKPIVFMRGDGEDWLVMLRKDLALRLIGNELGD